jgi:hypothetical protein
LVVETVVEGVRPSGSNDVSFNVVGHRVDLVDQFRRRYFYPLESFWRQRFGGFPDSFDQ